MYLAIIVKDQKISTEPKLICIKHNNKSQTDFKEIPSNNSLKSSTEKQTISWSMQYNII